MTPLTQFLRDAHASEREYAAGKERFHRIASSFDRVMWARMQVRHWQAELAAAMAEHKRDREQA